MATQNKRTTSKRTGTTARKKTAPAQKRAGEDNRIRQEVILLIILALSIVLLLSNFGLGGVVGRALSAFFFGLFGLPAYIFPILLFIGFIFTLSNRDNPKYLRKIIGAGGLYIFICSLFQLLMTGYDKNARIRDLYLDSSYDKMGGGLAGGLIVKVFGKLFGTVGAYILVVAALIIFAIIMTQEPLLNLLRQRGASAYRSAAQRRQNAREEQALQETGSVRRRRRAEPLPDEADEEDLGPAEALPQPRKISGASDMMDSIVIQPRKARTEDEQRVDAELENLEMILSGRKPAEAKAALPEDAEPAELTVKKPARTRRKTTRKASVPEKAADEMSAELMMPEDTEEHSQYHLPPVSLLKQGSGSRGGETAAQLNETAEKLQRTLHNFGVEVQVTDISCGPTVTRYELHPEQGVKVSRILSLQDDIKLNLAAADIRIEAPIPGKAAVGIEVPNKVNSTVTIRDLLESRSYQQNRAELVFAVGMDIGGRPVVTDLAKMPHLLIAGATGSGKSVCINTLIVSMLYRVSPDDVKFIMIDPKKVELSVYNGIPHLYIPVVDDPKKAAGALNWAVNEMMDRYDKFAAMNVRELNSYNEKLQQMQESGEGGETLKKLPRIVIIVDELADLMMVAQHEVEDAIVRLSQLARAAGIHLVIATQRPSVNVITGLIKANMPSRIALAVSSGVDSRTILDMNGAEKLLGKGDMLFYPQGYQKPARVQGAFVSDDEINALVSFLTESNEPSEYNLEAEQKITQSSLMPGNSSAGTDERDMYFADAGKLIIEKKKASIGMLQRAFKIGFNRAARIMDQLCEAGVVGEEEGTKPRKILMEMDAFLQLLEGQDA